ncbi:MAG TPA: aminotransferase class I/II-fold pyridoxal phosphate-dependent enzyme [Clostridium sp.]
MNNKLPLVQALLNYHDENNIIFSMPGNKAGEGFNRDEIGKTFAENLGFLDITEVESLDNLHHPEGVIKESQELLAKLYNVKRAYFLVNGSSGGNLASIFSAFNEGDEVLVERNCHRSVYNGLILRKLRVTFVEPRVQGQGGLFLPPDRDAIYSALERSNNPKGIILTYPNYFGITYDIEAIIRDLKNKGLKIIIDEAHGAHFGITDKLPKNVAAIADYTVVSAHKTLPALTGGSYLLVNDESKETDFYVSAFMTTSPSYLIMASLDYARYYLGTYGKDDYEELIKIAEEWKEKINALTKVRILSKEELPKFYDIDLSRYVITLPNGYSGHNFLDYLRKNHIQGEMSFHSGVVLILSPFKAEESLQKLYEVIERLEMEEIKDNSKVISFNPSIPKKALEPFEVLAYQGKTSCLDNAVGKIAREAIVPYPPGIPLICPGEIFNEEIIKVVKTYLNAGCTVLGVDKENINIV